MVQFFGGGANCSYQPLRYFSNAINTVIILKVHKSVA